MKTTSPPGQEFPAEANTLSAWFTPWRFAGILALLIVSCFPSVVAGLEAFVYGDAGQFAYPVAFYHRDSFWRGEIPFWNPLNSCGIPFLAQWNTLTLYPPSLFYLLFPLPWSFGVFCLGHIFLAAMGMYFLAFRWTNNRLAAAVAGTIFSFNGFTWQALMWPHLLAALAWMPWLVLAMDKAWRDGRRAMIPAALVGALQMLSGGAEIIILTWLVLGVTGAVEFLRGEISRGKLVARTLGIGLLVTGLAAIQIFPFLDLLAHSQRTAGYGSGGMSGIGVLPLTGFINYLVPLFRCVRNSQGMLVPIGQTWFGAYYLGVGGVALALLAVWRVRNLRIYLLTGLTVFSLLMALGEQGLVYSAIKKIIPVFGFIRFPIKFVALANFAIPLLAAFGLNSLQTTPPESWRREWTRTRNLVFALIGFIAAVLLFSWIFPFTGQDTTALAENAAVRVLMLALAFGCIALLQRKSDLKLQSLLQSALIVLLWFDVFTHTSNLVPTAPRAVLTPDAVRDSFNWNHQLDAGVSRAVESKDAFWKMIAGGDSDPARDVYFRRMSLSLNFNLLDRVAKFDGFYSLDLKEHVEIFKRVFFTTNDAPGLKDFLGISHTSNPTNIFDWVPHDSFLPLVTTGQKPTFANDPDTLGAIFSDTFNPLRTVYLPVEAEGKIHATGQSDAKIISSQFSSRRLEIQTEATAPAIVVIAQTFYHPWHAYVDGEFTELWRANEAFQAVEVPAGKHLIKLIYEDTAFFVGDILSSLSVLVCIVIWLWSRRKPPTE